MIPGRRMDCLLGVCRIGDFAFFTDALQVEIVNFVNSIAEIVHGVVDSFHGSPNSFHCTTGIFYIVWLLQPGVSVEKMQKMTDMAIASFVRIFAAVHSSRK